jgi:hypothetical protein
MPSADWAPDSPRHESARALMLVSLAGGIIAACITVTLLKNAYVTAGNYTIPSAPEAAAFVTLRTIRGGGEPFEQLEMEDMFRRRRLLDVESDVHSFATFTIGRMR